MVDNKPFIMAKKKKDEGAVLRRSCCRIHLGVGGVVVGVSVLGTGDRGNWSIAAAKWLQPSVLNTGRCKCGPMWRITQKLLKDCRIWTYDSNAHGWSEKQRLPFSSPNDCIHEFYPAYLVVVVPVDRRTNRLSCFLPVRQML
ncbi:uncharacterized protein LOC111254453 [Varroa destructor]|uniref:Uncharacterized protein n=1 Tax=Varroa destructor TaxID=109461 RepID=A0A7M7KXL9_VARDE|nr:uncharacterized protein LOC111254453 [Varroa destructor]